MEPVPPPSGTAPAAILQRQLETSAGRARGELPMYTRIADSIADGIAAGELAAGDKLPTHRALATALHVAVPTVSRAYREAEQRGLTTSTIGRGTFVAGLPTLRRSSTDTRDEAGTAPAGERIDLTVNAPARGDHERQLRAALSQAAQDPHLSAVLGYEADVGPAEDRAAAASWLAHDHLHPDPARIVLCHGGQHAILLALSSLLGPREVLLTEELTYPGLKSAARMLGLRVRGVAMDGDGIDPAALTEACDAVGARGPRPGALYLMPTAHNPTAVTMPQRRRDQIVEIARRHDLHLIEDDVFGLLHPDQDRPTPLVSLAPERTVYLSSLSKTLTPGLRWGAILAPDHLIDKLGSLVRASIFNPAPLALDLARRWLTDGTAHTLLTWQRQELDRRFTAARQRLDACAGVRGIRTAGLHTWVELHEPWTPPEVIATAAGLRIALGPTSFFHADAASGRGDLANGVRLCLGNAPSLPALTGALDALSAALDRGPTLSTGTRV